ncbi:MAG: 3'-5' exonuclease [Promethearchaeota archaeon]
MIFTQISQDGYIAEELRNIAPSKIQLCFKEIVSDNEKFKKFFYDIISSKFELPPEYFNILRGNLVPTSRLPTTKQSDLLKYFTPEEKIKLLDQEQEKLARELGEGHRLIFGVAGSGKTVLLIARARILAKRHPDWKILILCYNKLLKTLLFNLLNPQDYEADITISTFHAWARGYLLSPDDEHSTSYKKVEEKAEKEEKMTEFFQQFVPELLMKKIEALGDKKITYNAILIDEAQDFEESWFLPIMKTLNPESNSLLVTCDGLQGIYARKRFYWSDVGIQARGRVKRFAKSYRTPIEIGYLAQETLPKTLKELIDRFDEYISTKEFLGSHGTIEIIISETRKDEYKKIVEKISRLLKNPQDILVLFKYNLEKMNYDHLFCKFLEEYNIKWRDLADYNYKSPGLLIGTLHGTKGLESDIIIIPELDKYKSDKDRQLLYVGVTRSRKKLILSAKKSTKLIKALESYQT